MATDAIAPDADEGGDKPRNEGKSQPADRGEGGFFHIYKKGQGYWTRMGTAGAATLIAVLMVNFLYQNLPVWIRPLFDHGDKASDEAKIAAIRYADLMTRNTTLAICAGFLAVFGLIVFWLMNKPTNADFLIATDSEMKKVNWTSRRELIGSTKVVIVFMFLIAFILFGFDIVFGYLFHFLKVLEAPPL